MEGNRPLRGATPLDSGLNDFLAVLDAHRDEVLAEMTSLAMARAFTPEQWAESAQRSSELLQLTVGSDNELRDPALRARGSADARSGLAFADWYDLVRAPARRLIPHLVAAYAAEPARLNAALAAMEQLVDNAAAVIGEGYAAGATLKASADEQARRSVAERGESDARERARRLQVLAEASRVFAKASLDADNTLQAIARHCSDLIGDGCSVLLVGEDGVLRARAYHYRDPAAVRLAYACFVGKPAPPKGLSLKVFQTGEPIVIPSCDPQQAADAYANEVYRRFLSEFPVYSLIAVPIISDKVVGIATLARYSPGRPYDDDDLTMLQDLANRGGLALDNGRLYRDLQQAVQVRDDFLAMAGHELKTPLSALVMHLQSVQRAAGRSGAADLAERLEKAARSALRLEQLINQLLDVSRTVAGKLRLEPEPCELVQLVREVVSRFDEAMASPELIHIVAEPEIVGRWDRLRIEQVFTNLISNALKYGEGKPVTIELVQTGAHAVCRVIDRGIGIPLVNQRKIFERFERAVAPRAVGGFGLGLWITAQIVEASGGTIEVESQPGQGSTFTVRLPLPVGDAQ